VVPAQAVRAVAKSLAPLIAAAHARDRLRQGHRTRHEKIHDRGDRRMRARRGAGDFIRTEFCRRRGARLPTAVTLAASDDKLAGDLARAIGSASFRPYHSTDVRGVEIGGAAKNVLAIAAGVVTGRGLGASAAAALTTRGFAELVRFGKAYGAKAETMMGLVRPRRFHC
jgi:glycerol-3-phosphate dehydrogenase (NAD(P)+)